MIAVTGVGVVSPAGTGREKTVHALRQARPGFSQPGRLGDLPVRVFGEAGDFSARDHIPVMKARRMSRFSLLFRLTLGRLYRVIFRQRVLQLGIPSSHELETTDNYLDIPYEYRAARAYCRESGAKLGLVDVSRFSFFHLIHAHGLISCRNIAMLGTIDTDRFAEERTIARRIFTGDDEVLAELKARNFHSGDAHERDRIRGDMAMREEILARRVRSHIKRYTGKKIGPGHLFRVENNPMVVGSVSRFPPGEFENQFQRASGAGTTIKKEGALPLTKISGLLVVTFRAFRRTP